MALRAQRNLFFFVSFVSLVRLVFNVFPLADGGATLRTVGVPPAFYRVFQSFSGGSGRPQSA